MTPSKIRKLIQSQIKQISEKDGATKYFESQKGALLGIRNTSWLSEIKDYWYRVYDDASVAIQTIDASNASKVAYYQAQMSNARSFIDRLDNVTA